MRHAVEASTSRAKALGVSCNLYIVEGELDAYMEARGDAGAERFLVATRSVSHPWRVGLLVPAKQIQGVDITIETLWPRPSVGGGWVNENGLWRVFPLS